MKTVKKLPFVLAFVLALIVGACSDIEIQPVGTEDENDYVPIPPPKPPRSSTAAPIDTLVIG